MNRDDEPLVKGGQGKSAEETKDSATIVGTAFVLAICLIVAFALKAILR